MAVNNDPILAGKGNTGSVAWLSSTTANTKSDGTGTIGTDNLKAFTADSTYGAFVQKVRLNPQGSTAATATTATVARIYLSSQTTGSTTNTNTFLWAEVACPAQTTDQTTTATSPIEIPLGFALPAGWTILVSMHHAAAANTSWSFTVIGGDYAKVA